MPRNATTGWYPCCGAAAGAAAARGGGGGHLPGTCPLPRALAGTQILEGIGVLQMPRAIYACCCGRPGQAGAACTAPAASSIGRPRRGADLVQCCVLAVHGFEIWQWCIRGRTMQRRAAGYGLAAAPQAHTIRIKSELNSSIDTGDVIRQRAYGSTASGYTCNNQRSQQARRGARDPQSPPAPPPSCGPTPTKCWCRCAWGCCREGFNNH